jgi:hypothetical protein
LGVATPFGAITLARDLTTPPLPPTWFRVLNLDRWPFLSSQKGATHDLPREAPGKPSMDSFLGRDMGVSRGKSKKHSINWHQSASTMFSHMFSHAFPTQKGFKIHGGRFLTRPGIWNPWVKSLDSSHWPMESTKASVAEMEALPAEIGLGWWWLLCAYIYIYVWTRHMYLCV